MEKFQPITTENIVSLLPFFGMQTSRICDNTIGAIYQWRNNYQSHFAVAGGLLCIRATGYTGCNSHYVFPLGSGGTDGALTFIEQDAAAAGKALCYTAVPRHALPILQARYGDRMKVESPRDWADYLYTVEQFLTYSGKPLHTQRNHVNRFTRENPDAETLPITDALLPACMTFLEEYAERHADMSDTERGEIAGTRDLLLMRNLLRQKAWCLALHDRVIALSVGEEVGDTLFVHAEKADPSFSGIYPAMAQAFAQKAVTTATYINREDDTGDPGLRYSKMNYRPISLLEKYLVKITSP
ncbi:MAG: phosphatidylglycerol lysyltransferase domain-containing protein [Clostridiales bacterium]|nr:phosphatidylglycerol lysyltransferase domain-containing protein [Clostridiales bacterium]